MAAGESNLVGQQFGNYRLMWLLGRGAFAETYLAEHIHLHSQAAIKVFNRLVERVDLNNFRREAYEIAKLNHPNIVLLLDFGTEDNWPFLIMQFASAGNVRQRYPRGTQLPLSIVLSYATQMAAALQYAHDHKIIHRDVKPENMLLGQQGRLLLTDFGIAVEMGVSSQNLEQSIVDTVNYMAPEQLTGKPQPASDQYALAITIYEWLCGTPPFQGTFVEVVSQHVLALPQPLREKNPSIPRAVEEVVLKALAKDPQERYLSVQDFADALVKAGNNVETLTEAEGEQQTIDLLEQTIDLPELEEKRPSLFQRAVGALGNLIGRRPVPSEEREMAENESPTSPINNSLEDIYSQEDNYSQDETMPFIRETGVGQQVGNYRLTERIHSGVSADIYLADDLRLFRKVAVKLSRETLEPHEQTIFMQEMEIVAQLEHSHILPVYDFGIEHDYCWVTMPYAPNSSLRDRFPEGTRVPLHQIIMYTRQVADALQYAHNLYVVNRSVQPGKMLLNAASDILLSYCSFTFIARTAPNDTFERVLDSALYKAPEQLQGNSTSASDQYALGAIIYQWLCGSAPFTGEDLIQIVTHHLLAPPPQLHENNPDIPQALEDVVLKALAKNQQERYPRVQDFADTLEITMEQLEEIVKELDRTTINLRSALQELGVLEKPLEELRFTVERVRYIALIQKEIVSAINDVGQLLTRRIANSVQNICQFGRTISMQLEPSTQQRLLSTLAQISNTTAYLSKTSTELDFANFDNGMVDIEKSLQAIAQASSTLVLVQDINDISLSTLQKLTSILFDTNNIIVQATQEFVDTRRRLQSIITSLEAAVQNIVVTRSATASDLIGKQLGKYHLLDLLAQDHRIIICRGEDGTNKTDVTVKVLQTPAKPDVREQFSREIALLRHLQHPHILPMLDSDDGAIPYIVSPYMPDGSLRNYTPLTNSWESWSLEQMADVILQAADALEYLHTQTPPVIHRDVKPSNILMRRVEDAQRAMEIYLVDFKYALTREGTAEVIGTGAYMAPETWRGIFSPASDQYALGVLAYYLFTGQMPFQGSNEEVRRQHLQVQPMSPSVVKPELPRTLDSVILRALAKKPEERYLSVKAFADALVLAVSTSSLEEIDTIVDTKPFIAHETASTSQEIAYRVVLAALPDAYARPLMVGSELDIVLYLDQNQAQEEQEAGYLLTLPLDVARGNELNMLLTAPGFHCNSTNAASLPIEVPDETGRIVRQVAHFNLLALRPGRATVSADLYIGSTFVTNLETQIEVEGVDDERLSKATRSAVSSRPVPQPDLILSVQTEWNADASAHTLHYTLSSFYSASPFKQRDYYSRTFPAGWLKHCQDLLADTLEECADGQPEDMRMRLFSLGFMLFQTIFPSPLQHDLRAFGKSTRLLTLLILADQDAWLPWELLHSGVPGQGFLGEQFAIGRWLSELDDARPYEFPIGSVHVAPYANVVLPELWADLLTLPYVPPPILVAKDVFTDLDATQQIRGLHLLRYGRSSTIEEAQDAPMPLEQGNGNITADNDFRPTRLTLRRNRPLVSLGYVSAGEPELTALEQAWVPAFVRAGCSAFVGPLWAVQPKVEAAFVSGFYSRLWAGDALASALQVGRRQAQAAVPDSLDWLSYVLVGDPMARPYKPIPGQGYATVEAIGRAMDDPLPPGGKARFRASLRRTPPVWHEERVVEVAETLAFEKLRIHVSAFDINVSSLTPMTRMPNGDYLGWFDLSVPENIEEDETVVQVYFTDGNKTIHSLLFPLSFRQQRGGQS